MDKFHYPLCAAVVQNLKYIFEEGRYADRVIERSLKQNPKWGGRDRRFIAETTYNMVRNFRLLYEGAGTKSPWMLFAAYLLNQQQTLPDWKELKGISVDRIVKNLEKNKGNFVIDQSIPDWMQEMGKNELGEKWEEEVVALNQEAKVVLRTNTLRIEAAQLKKALAEAGTETVLFPEIPEALILERRQSLFSNPLFKNGAFELQDLSSQRVGHFMQVQPGMRVVDTCAGAGGKTLHLAALMQNKGRIIATDVEEWKLEELKKRAKRAGADNIEAKLMDSKTLKRLESSADRVLIDAPCSGMGVLKRNPDAKWKLNPEAINKVKKIQEEILSDYSTIVKPGGKLVYATCSLLPSENGSQVAKFLTAHPTFKIEEELSILPSTGADGFYMCRMVREA